MAGFLHTAQKKFGSVWPKEKCQIDHDFEKSKFLKWCKTKKNGKVFVWTQTKSMSS